MSLQTNSSSASSKKKHVAKTLKNAVHTEIVQNLLDRSTEVEQETWDSIVDRWVFDLDNRRPAPAIIEGNQLIKPTDLDLGVFIQALCERQATVQIPNYKSATGAKSNKPGEVLMSATNRRGKLNGLVSNAEFFSFSFNFFDLSVLKQSATGEQTGASRTFRMVNPDGTWYDDIDQIDFLPNEKENSFIEKFKLAFGDELHFDYFVHPNRWPSFFGEDYLVTKVAIQRAKEQASFLRKEIKRVEEKLKLTRAPSPFIRDDEDKEEGRAEKRVTTAFEAEIDVPWTGDFLSLIETKESIEDARAVEHYLQYTLLPKLRYAVRATEFAYYKHILKNGHDSFPAWIKNAKWETGYLLTPRARTPWNRLVLTQIHPGQNGVAIRYRTFEKEATFRRAP